jgi:hypothetical protein
LFHSALIMLITALAILVSIHLLLVEKQ